MSLYKRQKENLLAEDGQKLNIQSEFIPNSHQENENVEDDKTEVLCPEDDMHSVEEVVLPNIEVEVDPKNGTQEDEEKTVTPVGITTEKSEDPASASEHINEEVSSTLDPLGLIEIDGVEVMPERVEGYVKDVDMESASKNEEVKSLVDTKCDPPLLNSDMFSEASEAIVPPGSVNLSRIHHSPESTH